MRKRTILILAGAAVCAIAAVIAVRLNISVNREDTSISIIGGADGPTSIFIAGKIPGEGEKGAEYTSMTGFW